MWCLFLKFIKISDMTLFCVDFMKGERDKQTFLSDFDI
jgi:hypothetical protein